MKPRIILPLIVCICILTVVSSCGNRQSEPKAADNTQPEEQVSTKQENAIPVEALIVKSKTVEQNIPLTGVLKPIHMVDIVAEVSGKVTKIHKELGDPVTTRDTLAVIDDKIPLSQ